jgi:hypothetical protein
MAFGEYQMSNEIGMTSMLDDLEALKAAMQQVLGDMRYGTLVSLTTKAQARIAYEAFADDDDRKVMMTMEEARKVLWESF